ncbi:hypothetical protein X636_20795 [Pandoraea pnomenusa]|nr:hypothetical protein X636_20795 [Pandoraea pnomenusa]
MPADLRDRVSDEAKKNNRSMNAELIARLEETFSSAGAIERVQELEAMAEQHAAVINAMGGELDRARDALRAQNALIASLGLYLRLVAERVPPSDDPVSSELMSIVRTVGNSIAHNKIADAIGPIKRMIEMGRELEIFNADGSPGPNHPGELR